MGTVVEIVPYDTAWPCVYLDTRHRLEVFLSDIVQSIDHVGSTAVPDPAAKPYIDIDVVLKHPNIMDDGRARMEAAGFEPRGSRHGDGIFAFMVRDPLPGLRVYLCPPHSLTIRIECVFVTSFARTPLLPMTTRRLRWFSPSNTMMMAMPIHAPSPISSVRR